MHCASCGHANSDDAMFCEECGTKLQPVCASCGRALRPGAKFCPSCGVAVASADSSVPAPAAPPLPVSFANGRYEVRRFLGEGGKKRVYLTHDTALDRDVAFSLIKTEGLDASGVERLRREARVMGRLGGHPHIVSVFDIGEERGQPFLVSELMAGGDVEGLIAAAPQHRPPLDIAVRIADEVCQALTYAHEHGVIHRDLKPGNVWLTKDGTAKLGDFGLAMALDTTRLSIAGMIVGTVAYMPPEQALGRTPDARSDLYSLGAMLYEMTTGRAPFLGDDPVAIISQHIHTAPVAPSWHNPAIPKPLETLVLRLLAKDPAERPASAAVAHRELAAVAASSARTTPSATDLPPAEQANPLDRLAGGVFVGRGRELAELRGGLDAMLAGRREMLLLVGEPGIGKTRLAEELATYAGLRGAQVLWGRCYEWEGAPAYWPWVQLLRDYVHHRDPQALRSELGPGAPDIAQIVSEVRERLPDIPAPAQMGAEEARFKLFDGVTTFLKNASTHQPLMLVLDDLHWADKPTLLLLEFLARELGNARVLVVGTYRDVEVGRQHPLSQTLAELSRARLSRRILLRGLTRGDIARFVTLTAGEEPPEELVAAVERETEGNPFFVTEVVRLLVAEGRLARTGGDRTWSVSIPESVREVVGRRLSRLSDECNRALAVASVVGREFRLATLERVLGVPGDEILDLLEEAIRSRLLEERDDLGHYRFSHALVRETLYEELSTAQRIRLHRQIAEAIEALQVANLPRYYEELAHHYFEAAARGDAEKAIDYLVKAGDAALANLGYEEAILHYERALQLLDLRGGDADEVLCCEILLALGDAHARGNASPEVYDATYRRAAESAKQAGRIDLLARAALGSEQYAAVPWIVAAGWASILEAALEGIGPGDSALRVRLVARLAVELYFEPAMRERRRRLSDDAVEMARRLNDPRSLAYALSARTIAQWAPKTLDARLADAVEIFETSRRVEDWTLEGHGHTWQIWNLLEAGSLDRAEREIRANVALAERMRQQGDLDLIRATDRALAVLRGDLTERDWYAQTYAHADDVWRDVVAGFVLRLRLEQSRLAELRVAMTSLSANTLVDAVGIYGLCGLLVVDAYLGYKEDARHVLDQLAADAFAVLERDNANRPARLGLLAEAVHELDAPEHAPWLYDQLRPSSEHCLVGHFGCLCLGAAARYLALLATTLGNWDDAERHFADAVAMNERIGARPFAAHSRHEWADMLLRRDAPGDRERAIELVDAALAEAEAMGMTWLAGRALALKVRLQGILGA